MERVTGLNLREPVSGWADEFPLSTPQSYYELVARARKLDADTLINNRIEVGKRFALSRQLDDYSLTFNPSLNSYALSNLLENRKNEYR